ncbi:hypothetical protein ACHAW6_008894, partial [Cyclotella cf. meneghiniana]
MAILFKISLQQVDFVQAYPEAPIKVDMYRELPKGIETHHGSSKDHVLMLLSNLYGQNQAGCVWNSYLVEKLCSIGFQQLLIDECVFFCNDVIFNVCIDDGIFLGSNDQKLTSIICEITKAGLEIEDQGHPADETITKRGNGYAKFTQHALIDAIINNVHLEDAYTKPVPAKATQQLHAFKDSTPFDECGFDFNYWSIVGKLNYLCQTMCRDIVFATHQIAKYSSDPRKEHGEA